jgi:hypothetical protein
MTVQGRFGTVYTFKTPLTCIFDIQKRAASGINSGHFMLYNLSPSVRSDIEYDSAIDIDSEGVSVRRSFQFKAGYTTEGAEQICFQGSIKKATFYRDGPDVMTDIEVMDGLSAVQLAQIQSSTSHPWDPKTEVARIVQTMSPYGVKLGAIGSLFNDLQRTRGVMWLGSSWDILKKFAVAQGGYACIDEEKVYLMGPNDALVPQGTIPELDATTGLLDTPRRSGWVIDAQMLFEPRVKLMQQLKLASTVNPSLNGTYVVMAIGHRGIISGAKDGGCVTSFSLFGPPNPFVLVTPQ